MAIKFSTSSEQSIKRRTIDYVLLAAVALLAMVGFLIVVSAVSGLSFGGEVVKKHLIALPLGALAFLFGWLFNYQIYNEQYKALYAMVLALLIGVLVFGIVSRGSNSWFRVGFLSMQPAEFCRIATILIAAAFLANHHKTIKEFKTLLYIGLIVLPIFALIMKQPDFSSIVVTAPALLVLLYAAGVNTFYFALIFAFALTAGIFPILWTFISMNPASIESSKILYLVWQLSHSWVYITGFCLIILALCWFVWWGLRQFRLYVPVIFLFIMAGIILAGFFTGLLVDKQIKPYQRKRVEAFLAPKSDPKGAGYNVLQAQIAMGSGGVLGKGFFSGTQSRLGFVPERHTDFILAVLGEEAGLLGTLGVLGLYIIVLWRIALIAALASDRYGYLVCCGIFGIFLTYMIINFGMLIGILPVAGIPLPLISYGGSNLVASMWAFGVVESVYKRRLTVIA
ncbi:MAG: rod shape-determining protein RodA [Elusimicrobiota bacterium]|jgi:rod shape determining protein RodA|nr:rod shape-determining protein RodA [Elusimicrobiota bacterium]